MSKAIFVSIGLLFLLALTATLVGQEKKTNKYDRLQPAPKRKRLLYPDTYLGKSHLNGGRISVKLADSLLKQGVWSQDSFGNKYNVVGFNFEYYERMVYEDSAANTLFLTDYAVEYCTGDTLSPNVRQYLYDRIKVGDTFAVVKVIVARPNATKNTDTFFAKGMRFYLTK